MIGLLQRVTQGRVEVEGEVVGEIQRGLLVLVGVERHDTEARADRLLQRLLGYRVFADVDGRMNLCLTEVERRAVVDTPVHPGGGYSKGHAAQFFLRRRSRYGPAPVRLPVYPGPRPVRAGGDRGVRG